MAPLPDQINFLLRDQASLFDAVDSLRHFGVESGIEVPQLIVIGDQNSGKSSVLEAISGCHFAIHHNLCTRFPIELALRKSDSPEINVKASIVPSTTTKRTAEEMEKIKTFKPSDCQANKIQHIIKEAEEVMGISPDGEKQFSDDVLRISITGQKLYPITLIDLPGLYRAKGLEQGKEGIGFVRELVERYAKNDQSIILAVVSASSDPATQESHHIAQQHDEKQERTLGIITRPDTIDIGPETDKIINLALSGPSIVKKGWHTVRNLSAREREKMELLDESERSRIRDGEEERFLGAGAWEKVPADVKGIKTLRKKLRRLLMDRVRTSLPDLISAVRQHKENRLVQLNTYSKPRKTPEDQRAFLVPMSQEFVRLANAAILGSYEDNFFGRPGDGSLESQHTRLRAMVLEMSRLFNIVMIACGRRIEDEDDDEDDEDHEDPRFSKVVHDATEVEELFTQDYRNASNDQSSALFQDISSSVLSENELRRYVVHRKPTLVKWRAMGSFICAHVAQWRGREGPGDANSALARGFFRFQTSTWHRIVEHHYEAVWSAVRTFVHTAIGEVVHQLVRPGVIRYIIEPALRDLQQRFKTKCNEIVEGFRQVDPTQFVGDIDNVANVNKKAEDLLQSLQRQHRQQSRSDDYALDLNDESNRIRLVSGIKSWRLATYCRRSTRDALLPSIQALAVETCIRQVPNVFSPEKLMELPPEKLDEAAGETDDHIECRKNLEKDIGDLEKAESTFEVFISTLPFLDDLV